MRSRTLAAVIGVLVIAPVQAVFASGHGPVFGMTTPTNAAGGWAVDFGAMGRIGESDNASATRTMLTYGLTEDFQISGSVPIVVTSASLPASRMTGMMPGGGDFEGITQNIFGMD